jgi:hypothetical protein
MLRPRVIVLRSAGTVAAVAMLRFWLRRRFQQQLTLFVQGVAGSWLRSYLR